MLTLVGVGGKGSGVDGSIDWDMEVLSFLLGTGDGGSGTISNTSPLEEPAMLQVFI